MSLPYEEWRKLSYKEVLYERQLREQARKEQIAGLQRSPLAWLVARQPMVLVEESLEH